MRKILLPALLASVVLALAGPADAAVRDIHDPAGDLMIATSSQDSPDGFTYEQSDDPNGDIVRARIKHTRTSVVLITRYRELLVPESFAGLEYRVIGNNGTRRSVSLGIRHRNPQGRTSMSDLHGRQVHCRMSHEVNYETNAVKVRFPRNCMRRPRLVRIAQVSYHTRIDQAQEQYTVAYDDPMREGGRIGQVFVKRSGWVRSS